MKNLIFAAVLLLLPVGVAQAGVFDFESFSFANYGSPFFLVLNTEEDLLSALRGDAFHFSDGYATLADLLQVGPTSFSQEYDVGGDLHVAFAAEAVYRPEAGYAPGIGAKVSASNNQNPGVATIIGENYVYLKDTVFVNNPSDLDKLMKSYEVNTSLDGVIHVSGDAIAQVGEAIRITFDDDTSYTVIDMQTFQPGFGGVVNTYHFGQPGYFGDPIALSNPGPHGTDLYAHGSRSVTIETLLYVRAQTGGGAQSGGLQRGAGTASADFSNTLRVSNIQFFDENDQVLPGLEVVGSNGDIYPYNAVPEPATLALFGTGSIGLLLARFRRAHRS